MLYLTIFNKVRIHKHNLHGVGNDVYVLSTFKHYSLLLLSYQGVSLCFPLQLGNHNVFI